jgi:hypothetical protein
VAENGEYPGDEFALHAVDFDVLIIEKLHQGLRHGQSCRGHACTLFLLEVMKRCMKFACGLWMMWEGARVPTVRTIHDRSHALRGNDQVGIHFAVGMLNSAPLAMLSGQRCITLL